jgi:hypothetical protein
MVNELSTINDSKARQHILLIGSCQGKINQGFIRRLTNHFHYSIEYQNKLLTCFHLY